MANPLFDGLGITNPELLTLFLALAAMLTAPFVGDWATRRSAAWTVGAMALAGVGLLAFIALRDPASARTPASSHVWHVTEAATGRARLVSTRESLDPWTRKVMAAHGRPQQEVGDRLFVENPWVVSLGRTAPAFTPTVTAQRSGETVTIAYADGGIARDLRLALTFDRPLQDLRLNGRPVEGLGDKPGRSIKLRWYGREGLRISFRAPAGGSASVRWQALADGWPAGAKPLPKRPAGVMAQGSSDSTVVTGRQALRW